ncbi:amidase [Aquabacter sp. CN5-332]|uniref:amidase n=1 Tax=Aquabacter sp. CN5-332 TaxID=3156608 RepID=UPI0032B5BDE0
MRVPSYAEQTPTFASGHSSPDDMLKRSLARIDEREPEVKAFVHLARERALREAEEATRRWHEGKPRSPIDGLVVAVKDIIETEDMPTGQGSPIWTGFETRRDAASVQALREAGAIILGKTATTEFAATEQNAPTANPHDPRRTPGGSSSGSAAAVGAGMVPVALGSQVVGSTLRPASYCGCIGFKPSYGTLNRSGTYDHLSQSCVGLFGQTLEDIWAVAQAIATRVGGDPGERPLTGPETLPAARAPKRVAVLETAGWAKATPGAVEAFEAELARLAAHGVEVVHRTMDGAVERLEEALSGAFPLTTRINAWEMRWPLAGYVRSHPEGVSAAMRRRLVEAEAMTPADYAAALEDRTHVREIFADTLSRFDGAVALAATGAAPLGLGYTGDPVMNVPASLLGVPAISLPLLEDQGLPLGLQVMGLAGEDAALMGLAAWRWTL